jgi:lysophospholipase L1-like esterase
MKIVARRVGLVIISFAVSILIGEACLEIFRPVPDPYLAYKSTPNPFIRSAHPPNARFFTEPEEGLSGIGPHNVFSTNNMGFRGDYLVTPKPKNEFRIFMVGGSTTECFYLDDAKALNRVLQEQLASRAGEELSVKVYGAGKSGDASDDHISMIVHRIVQLEPDMIVLFAGINDLTRAIYNYDYLHIAPAAQFFDPRVSNFKLWATDYQIPRRLYYLKTRLLTNEKQAREQIALRTNIQEKKRLGEKAPISNDKPRVDLNAYSSNLRTIAGAARANHIQLVFITQQSTWNSTIDPEVRKWHAVLYRNGVNYREDLMDQALETLNDQMRRIATEDSIPIYDLAKSMPKSLEFFYDDVHFNENGARRAATELATLMTEKRLIRR